jgi:hypothetical protein
MDEDYRFQYRPGCQAKGCHREAVFKIAAPWSDGTRNELKNYGTFCEIHAPPQLDLAQHRKQGIRLVEGESIGAVNLYPLIVGRRDAELQPMAD